MEHRLLVYAQTLSYAGQAGILFFNISSSQSELSRPASIAIIWILGAHEFVHWACSVPISPPANPDSSEDH